MNKGHFDVDCTRKCRSQSHGQSLTSAITKRSISDQALACYIKGTCANFSQTYDVEGRTALHMSASRGRVNLMDWLLRHSNEAFINARDNESGYTPLHRSIFYGQIHAAVALMKIGANTQIIDKDDYKAIEHLMLDRQYMAKPSEQPCDVYVWGTNSNYTLGTGTQQQRKTPELLTCFSRLNTSVKQVCLGKFHAVWVCESGAVLCGGQLRRAGGAGAAGGTALRPTPLLLSDTCARAAVTLDSTVLMTTGGAILQYRMSNTDTSISQSNSKTPSVVRLPSVKPILKLSEPLGLCSSRVHVVVWNAHAVYTWGTNLGQLGHSQPADKYIDTPKRVAMSVNNKEEASIQLVAASDAATVVSTSRGDVYLLYKHLCKKIAVKQINLRQVTVEASEGARVTVMLLTSLGQLLLWHDTSNRLTRCVFGLSHQTVITHVTLTQDAVYFTTKYGEAFQGSISRKTSPQPVLPAPKRDKDKEKSALVKFLEKDDCTNVRITRIPNLHRAVSITVDSEGLNFACLQKNPSCDLRSLPMLSPSELSADLDALLETASLDDMLHDVVFKVGTRLFPAHIFIVSSGSEYLHKLYQDQKLLDPDSVPQVTLDNVIPEVFERILKYLYTGTCDVTEAGQCALKVKRDDIIKDNKKNDLIDTEDDGIDNPLEISAFEVYKNNKNRKQKVRREVVSERPQYLDPVKMVKAAAKQLHVMGLHKLLEKVYYRDGRVHSRESAPPPPPSLRRAGGDVAVAARAGQTLAAHRALLAARLDYFRGMFTHGWTESKQLSTVSLPINDNILLPIIDFLYTDSCPEVETSDSLDFICSLLIVADQLFITRLREMCEVALANMVTLKNCTELCQFAHTYNAPQLKQCCMEFIALNLANIFENRSLEMLDDSLLEDISNYYCKFNPIMSSRVITPFYNAPDDDTVNEYVKTNPVNMEFTDEEYKKDWAKDDSKRKNKSFSKKTEYTESEKARKRYESVSSVNSLDLSLDTSTELSQSLNKSNTEKIVQEKREKWTEIPTSHQKQLKIIQARLKAVTSAKDILNESPPKPEYFTLTRNNSNTLVNSSPNGHENMTRMSVSPKESPLADLARSPQGNFTISHIGPKLSQKQRKKLALENSDSSPQSLSNYFDNKLAIDNPPCKPKNPWKIIEVPTTSSPIKPKALEFNQILADQKKQKDDSSRIMTKSLALTQLEDKAIEDLEKFYNVHEIDDELITVQRIELQVSSPQWPHAAPK